MLNPAPLKVAVCRLLSVIFCQEKLFCEMLEGPSLVRY